MNQYFRNHSNFILTCPVEKSLRLRDNIIINKKV